MVPQTGEFSPLILKQCQNYCYYILAIEDILKKIYLGIQEIYLQKEFR
jgi:hypothetical protein